MATATEKLARVLDRLEAKKPIQPRDMPALDMDAGELISILSETGWGEYLGESPVDSGDGSCGIRGAGRNGDAMLSLGDDGQWYLVYELYARLPATWESRPEGMHDGLRDGSWSRMVSGPRERVWRYWVQR